MTIFEIILGVGGGAGLLGLLVRAARSGKLSAVVSRVIANAMVDIEDTVRGLKTVVEAQGESIEWLRSELDSTKRELLEAREQLQKTEALAAENAQLRSRVAELEAHVLRLEDELKRRRGGRPKKEVSDG